MKTEGMKDINESPETLRAFLKAQNVRNSEHATSVVIDTSQNQPRLRVTYKKPKPGGVEGFDEWAAFFPFDPHAVRVESEKELEPHPDAAGLEVGQ